MTENDIMVRPAKLKDMTDIAHILKELGWFEHINEESFKETEMRLQKHFRLTEADDSHNIWVAEDENGDVIGYISVHWLPYLVLAGLEGYVSEMFVLERARGKGVGARMLDAVKEEARRHGCSQLMLVNSRTRDSYVRGFYQKQGWEEQPIVANFVYELKK